MARLRTVGWETQKLGTSRNHGEDHPGGNNTAGGFDSLAVGAINTSVPRSGAACLAVTGTVTGDRALTVGAVLGRAFYQRIGFRFTAAQSSATRILEFHTVGNVRVCGVRLATTDVLQLVDNAGTQVGSDSPALSHDQWYRLELKAVVAASPTSSNGILEVRLYDDTTGLMIWNESSSAVDLASTAIDRARAGNVGAVTIVGSIYFDDWAINDDQGTVQNSWPGNGKIVLLKPISDNARVGWTAGAGATTSLFEAVNNFAPVGVATGSATDASQIKDATNNATDTYDANVAAYSTAVASGGGGLVSGDTVRLVQAVARIGNSTTTPRLIGVNNLSNPAGSERTDSNGAAAAGTEATGWYSIRNAVQYAPSVTLGTSPVVRVRKATATAETATVDLMGLYVEYCPPMTLDPSTGVSSASLGLTAPTQIPLAGADGAGSATLTIKASTQIPLASSTGQGSAALSLAVPTEIPMAPSAGAGSGALSLKAPTQVPLAPSAGEAAASLALSALTQLALGASSGQGSGTLGLTAPTRIPLAASSGVAVATLALSAAAQIPLGASSGLGVSTLVLKAPTQIPLGVSAGLGAALLALTAASQVPLASATGVGSGTLALGGPTQIALGASNGLSVASLALTVPIPIAINPASGVSAATLALTAATQVILAASSGSASPTLALNAAPQVILGASSGVATPTLELYAPIQLALGASSGVGTAALVLRAPTQIPLDPAAGQASASLTLHTAAALLLGASAGQATTSLLLVTPSAVVLAVSAGQGSGTLVLTIPTTGPWFVTDLDLASAIHMQPMDLESAIHLDSEIDLVR